MSSTAWSSATFFTWRSQNGCAWKRAVRTFSGNWTTTFVVSASSRSFGTRTTMRENAPGSHSFGWIVTWATAAAGNTTAARAMQMAIRRSTGLLTPSDRNGDVSGQQVELAHQGLDAEIPVARDRERGALDHVRAGVCRVGLGREVERSDVLARQGRSHSHLADPLG